MNIPFAQYRTLIADDEQPARDRLKKLLADHPDKIEVIGEAQNGSECREMIDRLKPDLVFLDIQMPGLTGFEVLRKRHMRRSLFFVRLTTSLPCKHSKPTVSITL